MEELTGTSVKSSLPVNQSAVQISVNSKSSQTEPCQKGEQELNILTQAELLPEELIPGMDEESSGMLQA